MPRSFRVRERPHLPFTARLFLTAVNPAKVAAIRKAMRNRSVAIVAPDGTVADNSRSLCGFSVQGIFLKSPIEMEPENCTRSGCAMRLGTATATHEADG